MEWSAADKATALTAQQLQRDIESLQVFLLVFGQKFNRYVFDSTMYIPRVYPPVIQSRLVAEQRSAEQWQTQAGALDKRSATLETQRRQLTVYYIILLLMILVIIWCIVFISPYWIQEKLQHTSAGSEQFERERNALHKKYLAVGDKVHGLYNFYT